MIIAELKKLFIKNRMIYLALVVLVFSLFSQLESNTFSQFPIEREQSFYMQYMSLLRGKSNNDKIQIVTDLQNDYNNFSLVSAQLEKDKADKKIEEKEYKITRERLDSLQNMGNVVNYIADCTRYVNENPEQRYFIDYLGWTQVFQNYGFDFLLMIFVLVLAVNSVMLEYNSDMVTINGVSTKGHRFFGMSKLIAVVVSTAVITIILSIIHLLVFCGKYDLAGFDYPLESLKAYSDSQKYLTIIGAYCLVTAIKVLGYCSFAVFSMFFAVIIRKTVPAMTFSFSLVFVPMYILNSNTEGQICYLLPIPTGAMMSTGYINVTKKSDFTDEIFFREVSTMQLLIVLAALIATTAVMAFYISRKLSGKTTRFHIRKKVVMVAMCLCTVLMLSSCSSSYCFEEPDENYSVDYSLNAIYSKKDDEYIMADALPTDVPSQIGFISGKNAVVKVDKTINLINLETFEKSELVVIGTDYDMSGFLGLEDLFPNISAISLDIQGELLTNLVGGKGNELYFHSQNGYVSYNLSNGRINPLSESVIENEFRE